MRTQPPPPKRAEPQSSVNVYRGQTAAWIKMTLGMEVGLDPGDFVFDGDSATPQKMAQPPHPLFGPCLLWPNGEMDEDATWYWSRPRPRPHCIRRGPSSLRERYSGPPSFRPMSIMATVAHLSYCRALVTFTFRFEVDVLQRSCKHNRIDTCTQLFSTACRIISETGPGYNLLMYMSYSYV